MRQLIVSLFSASILFSTTSCSPSESRNSSTAPASTTTTDKAGRTATSNMKVYATKADFPECTSTEKDQIAFASDDKTFYVCDTTAWQSAGKSLDPGETPIDTSLTKCTGDQVKAMPLPDSINGQLVLDLPTDIDPCSAQGYLVGNTDAKVDVAPDGTAYISGVSGGFHDIIVTAGTIAVGAELTSSEASIVRGVRIPRVLAMGDVI